MIQPLSDVSFSTSDGGDLLWTKPPKEWIKGNVNITIFQEKI